MNLGTIRDREKSSTGGRGNKKGFIIFDKPFSPERNAQKEASKLAKVSKGYVASAEKLKQVSLATLQK